MYKGGAFGSFSIRLNWPPSARALIASYGSQKIERIFVRRNPLKVEGLLNKITFGHWAKAKAAAGYDTMFHLYMQILLENGVYLLLEKNQVIKLIMEQEPSHSQVIIPVTTPITLSEFLNNARQFVHNDKLFFSYDPFNNNCQVFVNNVLQGNAASLQIGPDVVPFIMQKTDVLQSKLPSGIVALARKGINIATKFDHFIHGGSLFSGVKSMAQNPAILINYKTGEVYDTEASGGGGGGGGGGGEDHNQLFLYQEDFNPFAWYNGSNIERIPEMTEGANYILRPVGAPSQLCFPFNSNWVLVGCKLQSVGTYIEDHVDLTKPCFRTQKTFLSQLRSMPGMTSAGEITTLPTQTIPTMTATNIQAIMDKGIPLSPLRSTAYIPGIFAIKDAHTQQVYSADFKYINSVLATGDAEWPWKGLDQAAVDTRQQSDQAEATYATNADRSETKRKADEEHHWQGDEYQWQGDQYRHAAVQAEEEAHPAQAQAEEEDHPAWNAFKSVVSLGLGSIFGGSLSPEHHGQLLEHLKGGGFFDDIKSWLWEAFHPVSKLFKHKVNTVVKKKKNAPMLFMNPPDDSAPKKARFDRDADYTASRESGGSISSVYPDLVQHLQGGGFFDSIAEWVNRMFGVNDASKKEYDPWKNARPTTAQSNVIEAAPGALPPRSQTQWAAPPPPSDTQKVLGLLGSTGTWLGRTAVSTLNGTVNATHKLDKLARKYK